MKDIFLPDGTHVTSFSRLADAAVLDTPLIVGCGEPFDPHCVPAATLLQHQAGGGRKAANTLKHELSAKRVKAAHLKADQIRAAGHGTNNSAVRAARQAPHRHRHRDRCRAWRRGMRRKR